MPLDVDCLTFSDNNMFCFAPGRLEGGIVPDGSRPDPDVLCYHSEYNDAYVCSSRMHDIVKTMTKDPTRCVGYEEVRGDTSATNGTEVWFCRDCNCKDYADRLP